MDQSIPTPLKKSPLNAASDSRKIFCLRLSFLFRQILSLNSVSRRHPSLSFYVRCNRNQQRKVPSCSLNHPPRPTQPPVQFGTRQRKSSIFWFKPCRLKYCSWRAFHSSANQQKRQRNLSQILKPILYTETYHGYWNLSCLLKPIPIL